MEGMQRNVKQLCRYWDVDYWYPLDRCLATIDSAAMLTIGEQNAAGLAQIRKSPTHKTDLNVLDEYAGLFPQGTARYIVLVPDMETSDKFRLSLADPQRKCYIAAWNE
ncbi:hypothetical protein GQ600_20914 [Phytophthora cactorum]|nr:hypothetical protein GQ600_20914 [Phytophthora cactorum]